jgi:HEAT repeat protein
VGIFARGRVSYLIIAVGVLSVVWLGWAYLLRERAPKPESAEDLRDLLEKGDSIQARTGAAAKLGEMRDEESMPVLLRAMEDPDPVLRGRAAAAVRKIMGADYYFRAGDPPERRKEVIATIQRDWEAYLRYKSGRAVTSADSRTGPP